MVQEAPQRTLIRNADLVVTMDPNDTVLEHGSIVVAGNQIDQVGEVDDGQFDRVIEAAGKIVLPGLINTHHHTVQALLRGHPGIQNRPIGEWIGLVSKVVRSMNPDMAGNAALVNMAELIKYGCTTTTDMAYMHPRARGDFFEATVEAAQEIGMRFHAYRGSMSLSEKDGELFPDSIVEDPDTIIAKTEKAVDRHHDSSLFAMTKVGVAPCTIFTSTPDDYRNAAELAERYGLNVQTHAGESQAEVDYSLERFGCRPIQHLMGLGWVGPNVSLVHCVEVNDEEIQGIADNRMSVVHCPISNARASMGERGVAPIKEMLSRGVNVTLGTDGSAGNDSSNMREELRWARTVQGVRQEATYLSPLEVLRMATTGAARMLRWPTLGSLQAGQAADIALFDLNTLENAGSWDPLTAFVANQATPANLVMINGKIIVEDGVFNTFDHEKLIRDTGTNLAKLRGM